MNGAKLVNRPRDSAHPAQLNDNRHCRIHIKIGHTPLQEDPSNAHNSLAINSSDCPHMSTCTTIATSQPKTPPIIIIALPASLVRLIRPSSHLTRIPPASSFYNLKYVRGRQCARRALHGNCVIFNKLLTKCPPEQSCTSSSSKQNTSHAQLPNPLPSKTLLPDSLQIFNATNRRSRVSLQNYFSVKTAPEDRL